MGTGIESDFVGITVNGKLVSEKNTSYHHHGFISPVSTWKPESHLYTGYRLVNLIQRTLKLCTYLITVISFFLLTSVKQIYNPGFKSFGHRVNKGIPRSQKGETKMSVSHIWVEDIVGGDYQGTTVEPRSTMFCYTKMSHH